MYLTPPIKPMPYSLQEMAGRWCHQSVCLVLAIEVYDLLQPKIGNMSGPFYPDVYVNRIDPSGKLFC